MKKILFLTGTRADFGKLKTLINNVEDSAEFEAFVFVTGMHLMAEYGMTVNEVLRSGYQNVYQFINQKHSDSMDCVLAKTIHGLSDYVHEIKPDLIVVHGDRVEALAGAIVGSLNNILVAHIEGGEVSGTIDELIRHAVSKMSHIHFVSNERSKKRLIQLGERTDNIHVIGSPDLDVMRSDTLPSIEAAKTHYGIDFDDYGILLYHPVTTEVEQIDNQIDQLIEAITASTENYIVIYPNNDLGSERIIEKYKKSLTSNQFKLFPSVRFEYFLTLIKHAKFMIGNSSAGVRETPFYGIPSINIGTRQQNRSQADSIIHADYSSASILHAIQQSKGQRHQPHIEFGKGDSAAQFMKVLDQGVLWQTSSQKLFVDLDSE